MTPHFTKYKSTTLKMIKSLNLIDMQPIDSQALAEIFRKAQVRSPMTPNKSLERSR